MHCLKGYKGKIAADVPLADLTWYRLGGNARWMASPADSEELADLVRRARNSSVPLKVLGEGANVLIRDDGFDGVVVRLDSGAFNQISFDGDEVCVGAGCGLMPLSRACSDRGLSGLEGMAGIPGSVGGAICMNAGGRHGEFGDVVERVRVIDSDGASGELGRDDLRFGYRSSNIGGSVVVSVVLRLTPCDPQRSSRRFRELWARKKATQPINERSAGCVFKNPAQGSAGELIDRCGLKGIACGGARVSDRHANFIVTDPGATSSDVLTLIDRVRDVVRERAGIDLELEIDVW